MSAERFHPVTWMRCGLNWTVKGCDILGYAWRTPPDFRPHPRYAEDLRIIRQAFQTMER